MRKSFLMFMVVALMVVFTAGTALAAASVSWVDPANLAKFCVGTKVTPSGQAVGSGTTGTGLDLMFVLDRSGSMSTTSGGKTLLQYAKDATNSLIITLPKPTTQAGLVSFATTTTATPDQTLLPMNVPANVTTLTNKVNALVASGNTATGLGIQAATAELQSVRAVAGHAKMQVVLSDGQWNTGVNPVTAATAAKNAGMTVHTVGVPGHNATEMQNIATAGGGVYTNVTNLDDLEDIFNGTAGNLVGLDHVDILLPNGDLLADYPTDGLGNFILPEWSMLLGNNIFTATAFATDGTSASAQLTLIGQPCPTPIPGSVLLLGTGVVGLIGLRRKLLG